MEKKKFKVFDEYKLIFKNHELTELAVAEEGDKKGLGSRYSISIVMKEILEEYGIYPYGSVSIPDSNLKLLHVQLDKDIPLENEEILKQIYGYENIDVSITLENHEECSIYFSYNTQDYTCILQKHVYGTIEEEKKFDSFREMMGYIRKYGKSSDTFEKAKIK